MPPELADSVEVMIDQHLNLYDWGTSNPIYVRLASSFIQSTRRLSGSVNPNDLQVGGVPENANTDDRLLNEIRCGEGSYLEKVRVKSTTLAYFAIKSCM